MNTNLRMNQFYKTKTCPWYFRGRCERGDACRFAHNDQEKRDLPDLSRTSYCPMVLKQGMCLDQHCRFAHHVDQLRATDDMYKTSLCFMFMKNRCDAGKACRHAHGTPELRPAPPSAHDEQQLSAAHRKGTLTLPQSLAEIETATVLSSTPTGKQRKVRHVTSSGQPMHRDYCAAYKYGPQADQGSTPLTAWLPGMQRHPWTLKLPTGGDSQRASTSPGYQYPNHGSNYHRIKQQQQQQRKNRNQQYDRDSTASTAVDIRNGSHPYLEPSFVMPPVSDTTVGLPSKFLLSEPSPTTSLTELLGHDLKTTTTPGLLRTSPSLSSRRGRNTRTDLSTASHHGDAHSRNSRKSKENVPHPTQLQNLRYASRAPYQGLNEYGYYGSTAESNLSCIRRSISATPVPSPVNQTGSSTPAETRQGIMSQNEEQQVPHDERIVINTNRLEHIGLPPHSHNIRSSSLAFSSMSSNMDDDVYRVRDAHWLRNVQYQNQRTLGSETEDGKKNYPRAPSVERFSPRPMDLGPSSIQRHSSSPVAYSGSDVPPVVSSETLDKENRMRHYTDSHVDSNRRASEQLGFYHNSLFKDEQPPELIVQLSSAEGTSYDPRLSSLLDFSRRLQGNSLQSLRSFETRNLMTSSSIDVFEDLHDSNRVNRSFDERLLSRRGSIATTIFPQTSLVTALSIRSSEREGEGEANPNRSHESSVIRQMSSSASWPMGQTEDIQSMDSLGTSTSITLEGILPDNFGVGLHSQQSHSRHSSPYNKDPIGPPTKSSETVGGFSLLTKRRRSHALIRNNAIDMEEDPVTAGMVSDPTTAATTTTTTPTASGMLKVRRPGLAGETSTQDGWQDRRASLNGHEKAHLLREAIRSCHDHAESEFYPNDVATLAAALLSTESQLSEPEQESLNKHHVPLRRDENDKTSHPSIWTRKSTSAKDIQQPIIQVSQTQTTPPLSRRHSAVPTVGPELDAQQHDSTTFASSTSSGADLQSFSSAVETQEWEDASGSLLPLPPRLPLNASVTNSFASPPQNRSLWLLGDAAAYATASPYFMNFTADVSGFGESDHTKNPRYHLDNKQCSTDDSTMNQTALGKLFLHWPHTATPPDASTSMAAPSSP